MRAADKMYDMFCPMCTIKFLGNYRAYSRAKNPNDPSKGYCPKCKIIAMGESLRSKINPGDEFNYLTVICIDEDKPSGCGKHIYYICKCVCDEIISIPSSVLKSQQVSCGCMSPTGTMKDWSGQKFNKVTLIKPVNQNKCGQYRWECKCDCSDNKTFIVDAISVVRGSTKSCGCLNINYDLTDKDRHDRRILFGYKEWRIDVFKRDNFICQVCEQRSRTLHAHHLYSYSKYKNLRIVVCNGITLCGDCHRSFHRIYGKRNNTPAQFYEFQYNKKWEEYAEAL